MKRKMMLCERIMYVDRDSTFTIVQGARIRGRIDPAQLRHALDKIQLKHPMLRCSIQDGDPPDIVLENDPAPIPLRLAERVDDEEWQRQSDIERETRFASERAPLMRVVWVHGEDRDGPVGELLVVCHHCICDGMSMMTLLRETLALCDRPDLDIGRHTSINGLTDIVPAEVIADKRIRRNASLKALAFRLFFALRRRRKPVPQGEFYVLHWKLSREATAALAARARAEGVTMFAAMGVAFSLAFRTIKGTGAKSKVFAPIDIRKFLTLIGPDQLFAASPGTIVPIDKSLPPDQVDDAAFWNYARQFKTFLNQRVERMSRSVHEYFIGLEMMQSVFAQFVAERRSDLDEFDTTLSNIGRIDIPQEYQHFRVETVFSPTARLPWRSTTAVLMSGYAGELDFALTCDTASLSRAQSERVRDLAIALLHERAHAPAARSEPLKEAA
ncbi:condensation domain-containing protein [Pseudomonas sp. CGJS7]|uniref:condensation domain-containing protein n=1 Tax=Pseudomonas sp. CGJS7 TaxID=3109348 RepID=UPI00300B62FE